MKILPLLLAPVLSFSVAASAATPLRQPTKSWQLDYGETGCTALRNYGTEAAPYLLAFRPSPNATVVRLMVVRPGRNVEAQHFPVTTNISDAKVKTTGLRFWSKPSKSEALWINFPRADLDALGRAGEIAIRAHGVIDERFALPAIAKVLHGLDACNAELRAYWNVAGGAPIAEPAQPVKPLASYFSSSDYPAQAFQEGETGTSTFMLMIDESGAIKDCMIEATSGVATLDAMGCIVLRNRAKFRPARDAEGKPLRSVVSSRIVWRIGA
jgi:hypothetical protein